MLSLLFIFLARTIDVSLGTLRMILVIRGDRFRAAMIGFFEIIIYTLALSMVVAALDNPLKLLTFGAGFALGILLGSIIEEKISLGYRGVQVVIDREDCGIIDELREEGFPVTCWEASGKAGPKIVLNMMLKRNMAGKIADKIHRRISSAFVIFMEPKHFRGGYIKKK